MKEYELYKAPLTEWRPAKIAVPLPSGFRVQNNVVKINSCDPFPVSQIFMLNLDVFDDSIFSLTQPQIAEWQEKMVTSPHCLDKGSFNDKEWMLDTCPLSSMARNTLSMTCITKFAP